MTTPPSFPALPGQGWSVHKKPTFSTRVASHVSGREARTPFYSYPLYEFELTFDGLDSLGTWPGLQVNSLQSLFGFYLQCQGQFGTFLYSDPTDNAVTTQTIATGDGTTQIFTMGRSFGGFTEPVGWVQGSPAPTIYVNGTPVSSGAYTITNPYGPNNVLTFTTAPASAAAITASFSFAYLCRFLEDQNDFEEFMQGLWQVQSLKFRSVKA
jgi:uncharacterized protein (TIGR02217 family)